MPPDPDDRLRGYKSVRQDEPAFSVDLIYYQMYMLAIGLQRRRAEPHPGHLRAGHVRLPAEARAGRALEVRPGRPHRRQRRPRDLLGRRRPSRPTTASRAPTSASTATAPASRTGPARTSCRADGPEAVIDRDHRQRWGELVSKARASDRDRRRSSAVYAAPLHGRARHGHVPRATRRPIGIVVAGIIVGTVTALLAMGLILIYRTNRFINFAYGVDGQLRRRHRHRRCTSRRACLLLRCPAASAWSIGVVARRARRARGRPPVPHSSRLILTVASIGIGPAARRASSCSSPARS